MKAKVRLEDVLPLMKAAFEAGASFRFFQRGASMLPMLREGIDSVQIISPEGQDIKKGDVILYRRERGAFVLHRIVKVASDGSFVLCGDNQYLLERGVRKENVIGLLEGFWRGDEWVSCEDKKYARYVKKRIRTRILRRFKALISKTLKRIVR